MIACWKCGKPETRNYGSRIYIYIYHIYIWIYEQSLHFCAYHTTSERYHVADRNRIPPKHRSCSQQGSTARGTVWVKRQSQSEQDLSIAWVRMDGVYIYIYNYIYTANAWVLPGPAMTTGDASSSSSSTSSSEELNPY